MNPRRILLTGGSGFVGRHLMQALAAAFPDAVLTAPGRAALDITNRGEVEAAIEAVRPEVCIHLAAVAAVPAARAAPERAWAINLHGTLAIAELLRRQAPECLLLFASTADLYGASFRSGMALDEAALPAPLNTYAATKAAADLALGAMAAEGLRMVRLRAFNHTGPGQSDSYVVPAFARQVARIAAGQQPPVLRVGALDPLRDFLDVRDVCAAYVMCIQRAEALQPGCVLNLASGEPRRIGDILAELLRLGGVQAEVETGTALLRPADIPYAAGDAKAARQLLGWRPTIPWSQTLADVLADWGDRVAAGSGK
jgi:GDP-4-dehydro-6-deoxy-D-mannose reductase